MPEEITQRLGFDASSAIEQLKKLQASLNSFKQSLQSSGAMLNKFPSKAAPAIKALRQLTTDAIKASAALTALNQSGSGQNKLAKEARASGKAVSKMGTDSAAAAGKIQQQMVGAVETASKSVNKLGTSMQSAAQVVQQGGSKVVATSGKVVTATKGVGDAAKDTEKAFTLSWKTIGRIIAAQVVIRALSGMVSAFRDAQSQAVEFSLAIGEIKTISEDALGSLNDISDAVLALSLRTGLATQDVAEGLYQTLSNQVTDAADAIRFEEQAAKLAIVTHSDLKDAVNALSSVMNSYGLDVSETERVSAVLFKTVVLGRLRLKEFASVLGRVSPLTAALGISYQEMASAIAALTQKGVPAHTAITQLTQVSQKLLRPTEKLQALYHEWGVETGPEAIKRFGGLTGVLLKMRHATAGNDKEFADLLGRVRALVGGFNLTTAEAKKLKEAVEAMQEPIGAFNKALAAMEATAGRRAVRAWDSLEVSMVKAGREIIKVTTPLIELAGALAKNLDKVIIALASAAIALQLVTGHFTFATIGTVGWTAALAGLKVALLTIAPIAIAALVAVAAIYALDWAKKAGDSSAKMAAQFDKDREALTNAQDKATAARIRATEKEYTERAQLSSGFLTGETTRLNELVATYEASSKSIADTLNSTLDSVYQKREKMIKAMEAAVLGIDGVIKNSQQIIQKTQADIAKDAFARKLSGMRPAQQAYALLADAINKAAKAKEAYAGAGADKAKQEEGRRLDTISERAFKEAISAAKSTKNRDVVLKAERGLAQLRQGRIVSETQFQRDREGLQSEAHQKELARSKEAWFAFKALRERMAKLLEPKQKSPAERDRDLAEYKALLPKLADLKAKAFDLDLAKLMGFDDSMQKLEAGLVSAIDRGAQQWDVKWDAFIAKIKGESVVIEVIIELANPEFVKAFEAEMGEIDLTDPRLGGKLVEFSEKTLKKAAGTVDEIKRGFQDIDQHLSNASESMANMGGSMQGVNALSKIGPIEDRLPAQREYVKNWQDQIDLVRKLSLEGRAATAGEQDYIRALTDRNTVLAEAGHLTDQMIGMGNLISKSIAGVLTDSAAIGGKIRSLPKVEVGEGAEKILEGIDQSSKNWNATQDDGNTIANKTTVELEDTKDVVDKARDATNEWTGSMGELYRATQKAKKEYQEMLATKAAEAPATLGDAEAKQAPPGTVPKPATQPVQPKTAVEGTVFPAAQFEEMNNNLREADAKAKALKVSVNQVTGAFGDAGDSAGNLPAIIDGSIVPAGSLALSASGIRTEFDYAALSADDLKTSIDSAGTSTILATESSLALGGGLNSAAASADRVAQAMLRAAAAARDAAAAIAQATSAGAGSTYARNGGSTARYFASGGPLSRGHDNQVIMAQPGERIVSARNARRFATELQAMNAGSKPVYRDHGGPVTNVGDISVSVSQGETPSQTARDLVTAIRRELRRGTSRLG